MNSITTDSDARTINSLAHVAREAAEGTYGVAITALEGINESAQLRPLKEAMGFLLGRAEAREMRLENLVTGTIRALVASVDAKSQWTAGHSFRVAGLAVKLGQSLQLPGRKLRELHYAALLHDVGKIAVPERILENTTPTLSDEDMAWIKHHPVAGEEIVKKIGTDFANIATAIRHHHERWDGAGYPDGLAGDAIPVLARIIAVCDSYDAMRMTRPYQKGMSEGEIRRIFTDGRGRAWDAAIVDGFLRTLDTDRG